MTNSECQSSGSAETIVVRKVDYDYMVHELKWLDYLSAAGIDNTEAYDYACELARNDGYFEDDD